MNSMDKTREFLKSIGLPGGDAYDLPTSEKRFADGGQYRFGYGLKYDPDTRTVSVDAADAVTAGDIRPVTSAAVQVEIGNIEVLLHTI